MWDVRASPRLVRAVQPFVRGLAAVHRLRVEGLGHIPSGAALLVGNHGVFGYETPIFFEHLLSTDGRLPIGLADRFFFRLPVVRDVLVRLGGTYGCAANALRAFARDDLVVCYPGGARETLKREEEKYRCLWRGRNGFVRLAMTAGVPIVPFAAAGVDDTYRLFARMERAGEMLLGQRGYALPLGWGLGPLPRPVPFWFRIGEPILTKKVTGPLDESRVTALHAEVWSRTQQLVDGLVAEWRARDASHDEARSHV